METTSTSSTATTSKPPDDFEILAAAVARAAAKAKGRPLFLVEPGRDLADLYLEGFDPATRQVHNCHACRTFIRRFGAVVTLDERGDAHSFAWDMDGVPAEYAASIRALAKAVEHAPVVGVFLSGDATWGTGPTPDAKRGVTWTHFAVPSPAVHRHALLTAGQAMAEKREDHGMLSRALAEYPVDAVKQAVALLGTDALYRSEKVLGVAQWFLALHEATAATKNKRTRENLIWQAVSTAPAGFCHVRSSMIGTLLDDIAAGKPFDAVARAFAEKMHPLQYQRPTAPPSDGNIAQAEKIVATLRTSGALDRRFARVEDVTALWRPLPERQRADEPSGGVFGHLRGKAEQDPIVTGAPLAAMTWEKFARTVLPGAERIEFLVPRVGSFIALVTAANSDAPPIVQWDREDRRNPVTWYLYVGGSDASVWNLRGGSFVSVRALTLLPSAWHDPEKAKHHGEGVILILDGARDMRHERGGGMFPENLRSEYHAVRRTMEAHFQQAPITGRDEATACGYDLRKGGTWNAVVRVTSKGVQTSYRLDRWD